MGYCLFVGNLRKLDGREPATLPRSAVESVTLELSHANLTPNAMATRFREHSAPVVGFISRGKVKLDLRTIFPRQDSDLIEAIRALCG